MKYISHRGNIVSSNSSNENNPDYIKNALSLNYEVEIDLWCANNKLYLGHDEPQYSIDYYFLCNNKIWCHCKNYEALLFCAKYTNIHFFWHEKDQYTITSKGIVWAYPGSVLNDRTICVLPEQTTNYTLNDIKNSYGICSDKIEEYKKLIELC